MVARSVFDVMSGCPLLNQVENLVVLGHRFGRAPRHEAEGRFAQHR